MVSKAVSKKESDKLKPFRYASPAKSAAGCKAGTFDAYPTHASEPYAKKKEKKVTKNSSGRLYNVPQGSKSRPTPSVQAKNINIGTA